MKDEDKNKKTAGDARLQIPYECRRRLAISILAVAVFAAASVVPGRLVLGRMENRVRAARQELNERGGLLPLYESLEKMKAKNENSHSARTGLFLLLSPDGKKQKPSAAGALKQADLGGALMKITEISGKAAMRDIEVVPELGKEKEKDGHGAAPFTVDVSFKGGFENFRTFLMGVYALPYVRKIASLSISRGLDGHTLDFGAKIIMTLG